MFPAAVQSEQIYNISRNSVDQCKQNSDTSKNEEKQSNKIPENLPGPAVRNPI